MIKVDPPEGWVPPESASQVVDESDLTELRSANEAPVATKTQAAVKPQRQIVVGKSNKQPLKSPDIKTKADQPVLPDNSWTNQAAKNKQKIVLMICTAAGVLILALSLIGFLVVRNSKNNTKSSGKVAETDTNNDKLKVKADTDKANKTESDKSNPDKGKKVADKKSDKSPAKSDSNKKPVISDSGKGKGGGDKAKDKKGNGNPLVVDGGKMGSKKSTKAKTNAKVEPVNAEIQKNKTGLLDKLGKHGALFRNQSTAPDLRADTNVIDHEETIGIGNIYIPKPVGKAPKIDVYLKSKIPEIELPEMPLPQFLRVVSRLSNIPIKLDVDSFQYKSVGFKTVVKYSGKDTNYGEILNQTIEPLGLEVVKQEWGLIVRPTELDNVIERQYEIYEIPDADDKQYDGVINFLKNQFVPNSWLEKGGPGQVKREGRKFTIEHTAKVHFFINQYFTKLNAANEVKLGKKKLEDAKTLISNWQSISKAMSATSELRIIVNKPIQDVFSKVEAETGLTILIDWSSLVDEGWKLNTEIPWEGKGQSVQKTLAATLRSMKLGMRVVDSKTIQILSRKLVNDVLTFEVYSYHKVLEKMPRELFKSRVSGAFSDQIVVRRGMYAYFDDSSDSIIAILPQPLHRRLEKIIEIMSNEK